MLMLEVILTDGPNILSGINQKLHNQVIFNTHHSMKIESARSPLAHPGRLLWVSRVPALWGPSCGGLGRPAGDGCGPADPLAPEVARASPLTPWWRLRRRRTCCRGAPGRHSLLGLEKLFRVLRTWIPERRCEPVSRPHLPSPWLPGTSSDTLVWASTSFPE